ncbi:hypothetical protein C6A37_08045, partial [Desulfobacteraceae bacterium SEEP-SAG9]
MEDIQRKLEKDVVSQTLTKALKRTRRWTLIFVGNNGRIVNIRMFRGWITISAVTVFMGAVAAFGFYFLYQSTMDENKRLRSSLGVTRQEVKSLRHQKDILMARLVVAGSNAELSRKANVPKVQVKDNVIALQDPPVQKVQIEAKHDADNADKNDVAELGKDPDKATVPVQPQKPPSIGVEDLTVSFDSYSNSLKVEFIVRKMDPDLQSVSGRTFAILKPDETDDRKWFALPAVALVAGKPVRPKQGQFFGIARFKPITLEAKNLS